MTLDRWDVTMAQQKVNSHYW